MLDCVKFLLKFLSDMIKMLFTIDVGNGLSLGLVFCVIFIFFPLALYVFQFLKSMSILPIFSGELHDDLRESARENKSNYQPRHAAKPYQPRHAKKGGN